MSEILYFIQISCIFVGKSATFLVFFGNCSGTCTVCSALLRAKGSVSLPESSIHVAGFFLHVTGKLAKKDHPQPLLRHGRCPGDLLWVVMGRFAGQEYSFAVSWEYMALFCAL